VALVVLTAAGPSAAAAPASPAPPTLVRATSGPALVLVSQSSWVGPGQTFSLDLRLGPSAPAPSSLALDLAVYGCLSSVSAFDQALGNQGPTGVPAARTAAALPWSSLPAAPGGPRGTVGLTLPVDAPGVPAGTGTTSGTSPQATPPFTVVLRSSGCQAFPNGVYPLRASLVDTSTGATVDAITTDVVYLGSTGGTQRLRVATVVPLDATRRASGASAAAVRRDPLAALAPLSTSQVDAAKGAVAALAHHPSVDTTVAISGQTAQTVLDGATPGLASSLRQVLAAPAHEVPASTYTPLDVPALVSSGLTGELGAQVTSGRRAIAGLAATAPSPAASTTFVGSRPLDGTALDALAAAGYTQVVVPGNDVAASAASRSLAAGSTATPFVVDARRGRSVTVLPTDADLTSRFGADPGNPVLAAHQLLAELAQVYFEAPNEAVPRGVVATPPPGWSPRGTFLDSLLSGLGSDPVLEPVTISGLFAAFTGSSRCGSCRLDAVGATEPTLPAAAIRRARQRVSSFASAVTSSGSSAQELVHRLSDLVLSSEAAGLRPSEQLRLVAVAGGALDDQLATLAVSGDQSLTLTARKARIPVTIDSAASYPVSAVLTLSSDKLIFTNGQTRFSQPVALDHSTNVVYVDVRTRVSGEFKVSVEVRSPAGGLVLTDGILSVRSTATSVVGVLLTLGAIAVLVGWWVRTGVRRRAERRAAADGPEALP
jgi:hypothetical protein